MDIYETILDACWKHYWDSMEDDKTIIIDHIEGILAFVKAAQQKMHPTLLHSGCGGEIVQQKPYCKKCRVVEPQSG